MFSSKQDKIKENNMKRTLYTTLKTRLAAGALMAGLMAVTSCGDLDRSLVNSDEALSVNEALEAPAGYLVFSQRAAMQVATKKIQVTQDNTMVTVEDPAGLHTQMVEHEFQYNRSKQISIKFNDYSGDRSDWIQVNKAQFSVEKNSINTEGLHENHTDLQLENYLTKSGVNIRMQVVTGSKLEHIVVAFGPGGLAFKPVAKLRLQLTGDLRHIFKEGELVAFHVESGDSDDPLGTITKVGVEVEETDEFGTTILIAVPGFSRYTLDD